MMRKRPPKTASRKRKPIADALSAPEEAPSDNIGIVTVQDGPSLQPGEIIAPSVGNEHEDANYHNNYQDTEAFLRAGGRRGRQYVPLTDGTYFINRWFRHSRDRSQDRGTHGYVGGGQLIAAKSVTTFSGDAFRHGERVAEGDRASGNDHWPGKLSRSNTAGQIIQLPNHQLRVALG